MQRYFFYPSADKRQDEIWEYTRDQWGEAQAEKYLRGLHAHLQKLADQKISWHRLPLNLVRPTRVRQQAYITQYKKHYIFFRELSGGALGIMSILHEAMDIPVRLQEDLQHMLHEPKECK